MTNMRLLHIIQSKRKSSPTYSPSFNNFLFNHHALVSVDFLAEASNFIVAIMDHGSLLIVLLLQDSDHMLSLSDPHALFYELFLIPLMLVFYLNCLCFEDLNSFSWFLKIRKKEAEFTLRHLHLLRVRFLVFTNYSAHAKRLTHLLLELSNLTLLRNQLLI